MTAPTAAVHRPKNKQQQQQHHGTPLSTPSSKNKATKGGGGINLQFLTGLLLGFVIALGLCILMIAVAHVMETNSTTTTTTTTSKKSNTLSAAMQQQVVVVEQDPPGWKSIHVFFNDPNAGLKLTGDPAIDPKWFAQVHQDEIVVDLLGPKGYFIDLASNDAKEFSNTLALERNGLQWQGLCIEPNPTYWYGLSHRKCTVIGALVGGDVQQLNVKFRGVYGGIVGKMKENMANFKKEPDAAVEQRFTTPLVALLHQFQVPPVIDYMSLDVEGAELYIMKEFPFDSYLIKLLTIERPQRGLRKLLNQQGYVFLKDLAWWGETLWAHNSTGLHVNHTDILKIQTVERDS